MLYDTLPLKMAKKEATSNFKQDSQITEEVYSFPEWGIAVSASSLEEAIKKAEAQLKEQDNV